jgi:DNA polymerase I
MNKKLWIIVDCNYIISRAFHTSVKTIDGDSEDVEQAAMVALHMFMRDIAKFQSDFETDNIAFCFDSKESKRREIFPAYKMDRKAVKDKESEFQKQIRDELFGKFDSLRDVLPEMGYENVFHQEGYEADDLIAEIFLNAEDGNQEIIVSADRDLYQLLTSGKTEIYNPRSKKVMTEDWFVEEHGVSPQQWPLVKAIAGGKDNIDGVRGVGIKRACDYINGTLKQHTQAAQAIRESTDLIEKNLILTELPFPEIERIKLKPNRLTHKSWMRGMSLLGLDTPPPNFIKRSRAS